MILIDHDLLHHCVKDLLRAGDTLPDGSHQCRKVWYLRCLCMRRISLFQKQDVDPFQLLVIFGLHLQHLLLGDVPGKVGVHAPLLALFQLGLAGLQTGNIAFRGQAGRDFLDFGGHLPRQSVIVQIKLLEDELDAGGEGFVVDHTHITAHIVPLAVLLSAAAVYPAVTAPNFVDIAVLTLGEPGDEAAAANAAAELARAPVAVGVFGGVRLLPGAAGQLGLYRVPSGAVNDGLMVVFQEDLFFLPLVFRLFVGEIVQSDELFLQHVSHIFFIAENAAHHHTRPFSRGGLGRENTLFIKLPCDDMSALALVEELVVDVADDLCLVRFDGKLTVCEVKAVDAVVAKDHPGLHAAFLPPFDPLRCFAGLLLRHAGHDGEAQLPVARPGVDVVIEKDDPDPQTLQTAGVFQGIHRVPGKPGDLLGEDQIQFARLGVGNHAVELLPAAGGSARNPLIGVDLGQDPAAMLLNVISKICFLACQRVGLILPVGGDPAVGGHPQGHCCTSLSAAAFPAFEAGYIAELPSTSLGGTPPERGPV